MVCIRIMASKSYTWKESYMDINEGIQERNSQSFELKKLELKLLGVCSAAAMLLSGIIFIDHSQSGQSGTAA